MPYLLHVQVSSTFRSEPVAIYRFPEPIPSEVQRSFSEIFGYLIASDRVLKLFVIPLLPLEPITLSLNSSIWLIWMPREKGLVPALHCPARPPTGFVRRRRYAELVGHKRRNLMGSTMETSTRAAPARVSSSARLLGSDARHVAGETARRQWEDGYCHTGYHPSVTKTLS